MSADTPPCAHLIRALSFARTSFCVSQDGVCMFKSIRYKFLKHLCSFYRFEKHKQKFVILPEENTIILNGRFGGAVYIYNKSPASIHLSYHE